MSDDRSDRRFVRPPLPDVVRKRGACVGEDPGLFFPNKGGSSSDGLEVCARCPDVAKSACLEYALVNRERWGVWGGKTERERRLLLRSRGGSKLTSVACGTERGFWRHEHAGEEPCAPCRVAHRAAACHAYGAFPA